MSWLRGCVLLAALCAADAAVRYEPSKVHKGHEHECYVPELKGYLRPGRKRYFRPCGVASCHREGLVNYIRVETCPLFLTHKRCRIVRPSPSANYPRCCPTLKCP